MKFEPALIFVNNTLISLNIRDKIRVIGSDKIILAYWEQTSAIAPEALCFHGTALKPCVATLIITLQALTPKIKC